jgi:hypothetical protein
VILLLLVVGLDALPREESFEEVDEDIAKRFKVISSTLFNS